jgi:hypothetical protein
VPAGLTLYADDEPIDLVQLGEIIIAEDGLSEGEPIEIVAENTGTTNLRKLSVGIDGPGKSQVQLGLATDTWQEPGGPIEPVDGTLYRGERFTFWARGVYRTDDAEDRKQFKIVFTATSTG